MLKKVYKISLDNVKQFEQAFEPMKDVLVIQAARFGDLIQSKRLIMSLAAGARVHLALDRGLVPLAEIIYPGVQLHGLTFHKKPDPEELAGNEHVFDDLRSAGFSEVYNCNFSGMTSAMSRLFASKKLRGYRPAHDSLGGSLRSPWVRIGFQAGSMRAASPLNLVDFWGWFADSPVDACEVNPPAMAGGGGIGIAVAGREQRRSLPVSILAEITKTAFKMLSGPRIRLFGTSAEAARARQLMRCFSAPMQANTIDLCGRTDWRQLVDELSGLDLLLTPDTGIMHLGAHLGVPVLAFFLSSAWCHETGPYGMGHWIFQSAPACSPCLENVPCERGLACHEVYKNPQFLRTFAKTLAGNPAPQPGLQIWRSGFDDLGAKLELAAGDDSEAEHRSQARSIIRQRLELPEPAPDITNPEYLRLLNNFLPDSEWMLPPWRYC